MAQRGCGHDGRNDNSKQVPHPKIGWIHPSLTPRHLNPVLKAAPPQNNPVLSPTGQGHPHLIIQYEASIPYEGGRAHQSWGGNISLLRDERMRMPMVALFLASVYYGREIKFDLHCAGLVTPRVDAGGGSATAALGHRRLMSRNATCHARQTILHAVSFVLELPGSARLPVTLLCLERPAIAS
jgi:hypothetical protein